MFRMDLDRNIHFNCHADATSTVDDHSSNSWRATLVAVASYPKLAIAILVLIFLIGCGAGQILTLCCLRCKRRKYHKIELSENRNRVIAENI